MFSKELNKRIKIIILIVSFLFILVILKVGYIQIVEYKKLNSKATSSWSRNLPIEASRGLIYDANNLIIADNITTTSLVIIPNQIKDKESVAETFGIDPNLLEDMLPILSNYRNLCAHEDIVFDHKTERAIPDTEYHNKLKIFKMDDEYIYGKNDMFSVIIIFKYLLSKDNFRLMMKELEYEIDKLNGRIDTIPIQKVLDYMGFPKNYLEIVEM